MTKRQQAGAGAPGKRLDAEHFRAAVMTPISAGLQERANALMGRAVGALRTYPEDLNKLVPTAYFAALTAARGHARVVADVARRLDLVAVRETAEEVVRLAELHVGRGLLRMKMDGELDPGPKDGRTLEDIFVTGNQSRRWQKVALLSYDELGRRRSGGREARAGSAGSGRKRR